MREAAECRRLRREAAYREIERAIERLTGLHHASIRASRGDHPDNQIVILAEIPHLSWSLKRNTYHNRLLLFVYYRDAQGAERCAWVESLADLGQVLAEAPGSQPDLSNLSKQSNQS